jgi:hypothetical protein
LRLEQHVLFPLAGKGSCFVYRAPNIRFWRQIKHASTAVYCNDSYTTQWRDTHPELLAKGANIVGNVVIHPSAIVDPTARVCIRCSLFAVRCSLFAVRCSLFAVRCSLFAVR